MLAADGTVAESSAANLFFVRDGAGFFTPRRNVLLGIMRENIIDLAPEANVELVEGDFLPYDLKTADEIFLTTTSFSILPVSRLDGRSLPESVPGPVTRRPYERLKRRIGVDFIDQALAHLPADDPAGTRVSATRRAPEAPSRDLVGVDVGGTFTDVVAVDPDSGAVHVLKVPTTPADQSDGVLAGIAGLRSGCRHMARLAHGTTVATNALLEGTGARVALVTNARVPRPRWRSGAAAAWCPTPCSTRSSCAPAPLVPRRLRFEVPERLDRHGRVRVQLDEAALAAAAETMADECVEAVAVCFLHAYANAAHETRAAEILAKRLPDAVICTSAEVLPELREFERFSTAAINASLAPVMGRYVRALVRELETRGHDGDLYTMASGGGVMNSATTIAYPVRTILSGPASGVNGAVFVSRLAGRRDLVTYDMGGTSTDVCLVENLAPVITTEGVVNGLPVKTPQVEIHTVGAGGGSIAWLDVDGALRVGPRSAGAVPGPACYGQGGDAATVTDANLFLGRLSPALLDGGLPLHPELARAALARLADALGRPGDIEWIAEGIVDLGVATTASAIRKVSIQRGHDPGALRSSRWAAPGRCTACRLRTSSPSARC